MEAISKLKVDATLLSNLHCLIIFHEHLFTVPSFPLDASARDDRASRYLLHVSLMGY